MKTNREVFEMYPFLRPRDSTGHLVKYSNEELEDEYFAEIPEGWYKLFFQMCDDIKLALEKKGLLDKFYFLQIKEKYNDLRCYHNGATEAVESIINKYEHMACHVCSICSKPAELETNGYILSFCNDCWKNLATNESTQPIEFEPYFSIFTYEVGELVEKTESFEDEWNRYLLKVT